MISKYCKIAKILHLSEQWKIKKFMANMFKFCQIMAIIKNGAKLGNYSKVYQIYEKNCKILHISPLFLAKVLHKINSSSMF